MASQFMTQQAAWLRRDTRVCSRRHALPAQHTSGTAEALLLDGGQEHASHAQACGALHQHMPQLCCCASPCHMPQLCCCISPCHMPQLCCCVSPCHMPQLCCCVSPCHTCCARHHHLQYALPHLTATSNTSRAHSTNEREMHAPHHPLGGPLLPWLLHQPSPATVSTAALLWLKAQRLG